MMKGCPESILSMLISRNVASLSVIPVASSKSAETSIILAANSRPVSFSITLRTVLLTPLFSVSQDRIDQNVVDLR